MKSFWHVFCVFVRIFFLYILLDTICISIIYPRYHFLPYITRNLFNEFFSLIGERSDDSSRPIFLFALFNVPLGFTVIHCINFRLKRNHRLSGRYYTGVSLGDASKKRTNIPVGLAGARRISRFHVQTSLCVCVYVCVSRGQWTLHRDFHDNFTRVRGQMPVNYWMWEVADAKQFLIGYRG